MRRVLEAAKPARKELLATYFIGDELSQLKKGPSFCLGAIAT